MTEYEKMLTGEPHDVTDISILLKMARCYRLNRRLNRMSLLNQSGRYQLLKRMVGSIDGRPYYAPSPIYIKLGFNVHIGKHLLSNYNLTILDGAPVHIGDDVMIGPSVTLTTIEHPLMAAERITFAKDSSDLLNRLLGNERSHVESSKPITIGNRVWLCSGVTVCAGVTIGDNSVIGAGSVVTRDIPANVLAFGVPCRVVREITEKDRMEGFCPDQKSK